MSKLKTGKLYDDDQITMYRTASGAISMFFIGRPPVMVWPAVTTNLDEADGTAVTIEFKVPRENLDLEDEE